VSFFDGSVTVFMKFERTPTGVWWVRGGQGVEAQGFDSLMIYSSKGRLPINVE
jgi:hypothetical protein